MSPFTYIVIALIILYIVSFITKKIAKLILYTFFVFFGGLFIYKFTDNMYDKLSKNTNEPDDF